MIVSVDVQDASRIAANAKAPIGRIAAALRIRTSVDTSQRCRAAKPQTRAKVPLHHEVGEGTERSEAGGGGLGAWIAQRRSAAGRASQRTMPPPLRSGLSAGCCALPHCVGEAKRSPPFTTKWGRARAERGGRGRPGSLDRGDEVCWRVAPRNAPCPLRCAPACRPDARASPTAWERRRRLLSPLPHCVVETSRRCLLGQVALTHQVFVYRAGALAAFSDGPDDEGLAAAHVACSEDTGMLVP